MQAAPEEAGPPDDALTLRASPALSQLPAEPAPQALPRPLPANPVPTNPVPASPVRAAHAAPVGGEIRPPAPAVPAAMPAPASSLAAASAGSWGMAGVALVAAMGWLYERRRRRLSETEKDSVMWAQVQTPGSSIVTTVGSLDDILPDSPDPAESARAIYVTAIGETNSRREATLIDLHQLGGKLTRRRDRGDIVAAVLLLQQHLVDFRFTSPWVFLELRELYKQLDRHKEWEIAREAFRARFGQNAPLWSTPSTADVDLIGDTQLCDDLISKWPYREARMFILRWMLGEHEMRQKSSGPPLLALGIYREIMFLDQVLDEVMITRPAPIDSLL